jgi:murein DD-endopeptidase MepM/ murein hydrolase activator NlpD
MLALIAVPLVSSRAMGEESMSELQARMDELQGELNAAQDRIEDLRTEQDLLEQRMAGADARVELLRSQQRKLRKVVTQRAQELYMAGNSEMLEALLGSDDIGDLMDRTEVLSQVSLDDSGSFIELARSQAELERLNEQMVADRERLAEAEERLAEENDLLQSRFEEVSAEYERLKTALMKTAPAAPKAQAASAPAPVVRSTGGMTCPVGGATSFIDSWGYPRAGHTHQGVDMMGSYGTPLVAITSGTITLSDYGDSAGYWQILSGDDGHQYWYMHNQSNIVNGGHVSAGQQIATLGDTGNAAGTPHLHFEYHPGGGAAINPYPLVASLC